MSARILPFEPTPETEPNDDYYCGEYCDLRGCNKPCGMAMYCCMDHYYADNPEERPVDDSE